MAGALAAQLQEQALHLRTAHLADPLPTPVEPVKLIMSTSGSR
jgi:hypothetical protein